MSNRDNWNFSFQSFKLPIIFVVVFYSIAIWRYIATGRNFYIINFVYIGTSIAIGMLLLTAAPDKHKSWGRRISQLLVGIYMFGYLGIIGRENMQIEGFFFYILGGVYAGATLHYTIAKIFGVAFFNRGWCSWACWHTMILDLLPWKKPSGRFRNLGAIRYLHFVVSIAIVIYFWFIVKQHDIYQRSENELKWLIVGNILYYVLSIAMAAFLKDNRAFCKYLCPIPVLQKPLSKFALLKVEIDNEGCIDCKLCEKNCPMDIKLLEYKKSRNRILSTECILCTTCTNICPTKAVSMNLKIDRSKYKNYIKFRGE